MKKSEKPCKFEVVVEDSEEKIQGIFGEALKSRVNLRLLLRMVRRKYRAFLGKR